jgi:uncharacterized delta-60 repeat protein
MRAARAARAAFVATSMMVFASGATASAGQEPVRGHVRTGPLVTSDIELDGAGVRGLGVEVAVVGPHLDSTWSGDGIAGLTGNKYSVAMSPQTSGRLYVASLNEGDAGAFRLTRYEANGSLATSFGGGDGVIKRRFGNTTSAVSFPYDIARTGDKFVIVGDHYDGIRERVGVMRVTTSGGYDNTFSGDGRVMYRIFPREHDLLQPVKMQVLNGGKIAIALAAWDLNGANEFVFAEQAFVRLNANGTLDTSFSGDGIAVVSNTTTNVTWMPDGSAYATRSLPAGSPGNQEIRKLTPAATLDTTFSGDGRLAVSCPDAFGVGLQVNTAGQPGLGCSDSFGEDLLMKRYTVEGQPDLTYSDDGEALLGVVGADLGHGFMFVAPTSGEVWVAFRSASDHSVLDIYSLDASGNPNAAWGGGVSHTDLSFTVNVNRMALGGGRVWVALQKSATVTALLALVPGT